MCFYLLFSEALIKAQSALVGVLYWKMKDGLYFFTLKASYLI